MSHCYLAFRTNVLLNLCCPGHLSYYSPNESEPMGLSAEPNGGDGHEPQLQVSICLEVILFNDSYVVLW